ncbi:hypothetical protein Fot_22675 [Forsythia ovata]|uniref:Uncharacterized protein n=1 Tax=Forsythia ovata TaxID=205694 RepID=A0ABD1UYF1_9LAMI
MVESDAKEADPPRRRTTRSVRRKDLQEKPKVFICRSKMKFVEKPDVDEQPWETRVKKPSQWVTSPYTTKGQWRKHVDVTTFDLFRDVDPVKDKDLRRSHLYAVEVDIVKSTMFIYDRDRSCSTDDQIRADLKHMTMILPMLLKKINIAIDALAIEQIMTTSKQSNS